MKARSVGVLLLCFFGLGLLSCSVYWSKGATPIEWTADELEAVDVFFMGTVDLTKVRLFNTGTRKVEGSQAFAVGSDIYFDASMDFEANREHLRPLLVHEVVHVWQNQNYLGNFDESDYYYMLFPERHLTTYGEEEQARLIQDYYKVVYTDLDSSFGGCLDCEGRSSEEVLQVAHSRYLELLDI